MEKVYKITFSPFQFLVISLLHCLIEIFPLNYNLNAFLISLFYLFTVCIWPNHCNHHIMAIRCMLALTALNATTTVFCDVV
jgi:hypothetical protein